jgi:hypothetical protein
MGIACNEGFRQQVSRPDVEIDLMHTALLIAADDYPHLDVPYYLARLDASANEIRERVVPRTNAAL